MEGDPYFIKLVIDQLGHGQCSAFLLSLGKYFVDHKAGILTMDGVPVSNRLK